MSDGFESSRRFSLLHLRQDTRTFPGTCRPLCICSFRQDALWPNPYPRGCADNEDSQFRNASRTAAPYCAPSTFSGHSWETRLLNSWKEPACRACLRRRTWPFSSQFGAGRRHLSFSTPKQPLNAFSQCCRKSFKLEIENPSKIVFDFGDRGPSPACCANFRNSPGESILGEWRSKSTARLRYALSADIFPSCTSGHIGSVSPQRAIFVLN